MTDQNNFPSLGDTEEPANLVQETTSEPSLYVRELEARVKQFEEENEQLKQQLKDATWVIDGVRGVLAERVGILDCQPIKLQATLNTVLSNKQDLIDKQDALLSHLHMDFITGIKAIKLLMEHLVCSTMNHAEKKVLAEAVASECNKLLSDWHQKKLPPELKNYRRKLREARFSGSDENSEF
jgi:ribonuclease BN (tRNA processing enzyme)